MTPRSPAPEDVLAEVMRLADEYARNESFAAQGAHPQFRDAAREVLRAYLTTALSARVNDGYVPEDTAWKIAKEIGDLARRIIAEEKEDDGVISGRRFTYLEEIAYFAIKQALSAAPQSQSEGGK